MKQSPNSLSAIWRIPQSFRFAGILFAVIMLTSAARGDNPIKDCNCAVSQKIEEFRVSKCDIPRLESISAPITCGSEGTGLALGEDYDVPKWNKKDAMVVPPKTNSVPVAGTCTCGQEKLCEGSVQVVLIFDRPEDDGTQAGTGGFGDFNANVASLHASMSLGYGSGKSSAGTLMIYSPSIPSRKILSPESLYIYGGRGIDIVRMHTQAQLNRLAWLNNELEGIDAQIKGNDTHLTVEGPEAKERAKRLADLHAKREDVMNEIRAMQNAPAGVVKQIKCPEGLVQIDVIDENVYTVAFYKTNRVRREFNSSGEYELQSNAQPLVIYTISNPDGDTQFNRLRITEARNGNSEQHEFSWTNDGRWELSKGSGAYRSSVEESGNIKTWRVYNPDGTVASETRKKYAELPNLNGPGVELLPIEEISGSGPDALVTTTSYYTDINTPRCYGYPKRIVAPDGRWTSYEYDASGRYSVIRTGWLDGANSEQCTATAYSYAPFLPGGLMSSGLCDTGAVDRATPRIETVLINGVPISKTLRAVAMDTMDYRVIEEVRLLDLSENLAAAWNNPDNPRTVSWYMPEDDFKPCSKKLEKIEYPDGRTERYTYISGTYTPDQNGQPGAFEEDPTGIDFITIITQGTKYSPSGIPNRTTQERRYARKTNLQEYLRETYVCVASNDYERLSWTSTLYNDSDNPIRVTNSNGTYTETGWAGNLLAWEVSADGIRTDYTYDSLGRVVSATRRGHGIRPDMVTSTIYDGAGRVLSTTISADTLSMATTNAYDAAGRLVWTRGADGIETAYEYSTLSDTTIRGYNTALASTNTVVHYLDGRTAYTEFNGIRKTTYTYGISNGLQWKTTYEGPQAENSPVWITTISDPLDRTIEERRPGFGGATLITRNTYNAASQLLSTTTLSQDANSQLVTLSSQLFTYDELGEMFFSVQDINQNGVADLAGPDRILSSASSFVKLDNDWWQESNQYTYPEDNSDESLRTSTSRRRITGLGATASTQIGDAILTVESVSTDALGNTATQQRFLNRASHSRIFRSQSKKSLLPSYSVSAFGLTFTNVTASGIIIAYAYDALDRMTDTTDGRGNTSTVAYNTLGQLVHTEDALGNQTLFTYDAIGRRIAVTDALGQIIHTEYDAKNRIVFTWGATYPTAYDYDDFGRMTKLHTWRDENSESDTTQWIYDSATGLLTQKLYADGKGPSYTYTPDGQLATRTWARGIVTTYNYDAAKQLIGIDYSDSTPDITFNYNRTGNQLSAITAGVTTNLYAYSLLRQLTAETVVTAEGTTVINRSYDTFGRSIGHTLDNGHGVGYAYDEFGRFKSVSYAQSAEAFVYSYLLGSYLISGMTASSGYFWTRGYEPHRKLVSAVENAYGSDVISRFDYENDAIGRRVSRVDSGLAIPTPVFDKYTYNIRSEVVGAQCYYGTDASDTSRIYGGRGFGYNYDSIGNRITATEDVGGRALTKNYAANELNQYTFIINPTIVALRGDAALDALVTVNGETAFSDSVVSNVRPWHYALPADNAAGADYPLTQITAAISAPNANGTDTIDAVSGIVYAPPQNEILSYDDDGNLLSDGRWHYTWNGENRLVQAEEFISSSAREPYVVEYVYDHRGRMICKTITSASMRLLKKIYYLWDDYNIIAETVVENGVSGTTYNIWGVDIDGTMQGAGGIGGLLAVVTDGELFMPAYEANGNVVEYVSTDGVIIAHREYDPFGSTIIAADDATAFTHWFSTKPLCTVTGLSEYQFRKYSHVQGRWLKRDPIGERGGANIYLGMQNASANNLDYLGMDDIRVEDGKVIHMPENFFGWDLTDKATELGVVVDDIVYFYDEYDLPPMPLDSLEDYGYFHDIEKLLAKLRKDIDDKEDNMWNGGRSSSDYWDLRVTCKECYESGVGFSGESVAEKRCRDAIAQRAAKEVLKAQVFGTAEGVLAGLLGIIACKAPPKIALPCFAGTLGLTFKSWYDLNKVGEITSASYDAGNKYCDCSKYLNK